MKQRVFLFAIMVLCIHLVSAQTELTQKDKDQLLNLTGFQISEQQLNTPIPPVVNNSQTYFFPYVFYQEEYSCAQASSLVYLFTYELAVRRNRTVLFDTPYEKYHIPSHFAWNFYNNNQSYQGVSFMDTWHLIRTAGSPFTPDWGTTYFGGCSKWMTGYNKYYEGMKNRIVEMVAFPTNSIEGIQILRHWLANHGVNDPYGGCANIFVSSINPYQTLPTGTPEAGKKLILSYTNPTHSVTIVGYNDSIRYDFNSDGIYTNTIDITGDGVVDIKDWEIGGVILCNSHGEEWGDNGFAYLPYKVLARSTEEGGIWNACAYGVQVRDEVFPQITFKATIKHDRRNMIKLSAGISSSVNDTIPQKTIDFGVFNYQGGPYYMQGNAQEIHKTLELGLDVTPLLNFMTPNAPYKFFLIVEEADPNAQGSGEIINFSLLDYTGTSVVETAATPNISIKNNATTRVSVIKSIDFSKPVIQQNIINAIIDEPFQIQLTATQGKPQYRWEFSKEYQIEEFTNPFPVITTNNLTFPDNDNGKLQLQLPFSFPFFEGTYTSVFLNADGYITFKDEKLNWPYLRSLENQFNSTRQIAPFFADLQISSVKTDSDEHSFSISVIGKIKYEVDNSIKYVVKLYDSGIIEIYYGNMLYISSNFKSGIVRGDDKNIFLTDITGVNSSTCSNRNFRFIPPARIHELHLSRTGLLTGMIDFQVENVPFDVTCFDNNEVKQTKTLFFNSSGVGITENNLLKINAFPNPTSGNITIETNNQTIDFIEICSINGALIARQSLQNTQVNIDLSHYATGVYICKVFTQTGRTRHIKVIKSQ